MSTVFGILQTHGGHITCRSQPGKGTTFTVFIPAFLETSDAVLEPKTVADGRHGQGSETILMVDDEEHLREIASEGLTRLGYQLILAASAEEALNIYRNSRDVIDLVVLDISMPGMGGLQCLRALQEIDPMVKVIMASGYFPDKLQNDPLKMGAREYLNKPYKITMLAQKIRQVLDGV
ncbi:MAG: response regulator [Deltaproteobacteria bacterium]|nr:response regulator [Candidatus Anaeroferrophillus wilburensis]MBN2887808.1 response regulator [Deltaproteobacteria bacterium]